MVLLLLLLWLDIRQLQTLMMLRSDKERLKDTFADLSVTLQNHPVSPSMIRRGSTTRSLEADKFDVDCALDCLSFRPLSRYRSSFSSKYSQSPESPFAPLASSMAFHSVTSANPLEINSLFIRSVPQSILLWFSQAAWLLLPRWASPFVRCLRRACPLSPPCRRRRPTPAPRSASIDAPSRWAYRTIPGRWEE